MKKLACLATLALAVAGTQAAERVDETVVARIKVEGFQR